MKADIGAMHDFENLYSYNPLNQLSQVVQQSQSSGNVVADKRVDFTYNAAGQFGSIQRYADTAERSSSPNRVTATTTSGG